MDMKKGPQHLWKSCICREQTRGHTARLHTATYLWDRKLWLPFKAEKSSHHTVIFSDLYLAKKEVVSGTTHDRTNICQDHWHCFCWPFDQNDLLSHAFR